MAKPKKQSKSPAVETMQRPSETGSLMMLSEAEMKLVRKARRGSGGQGQTPSDGPGEDADAEPRKRRNMPAKIVQQKTS